MQVSIENVGSLGRKLTVRLPAQRLEDTVRSRIQEMGRSALAAQRDHAASSTTNHDTTTRSAQP